MRGKNRPGNNWGKRLEKYVPSFFLNDPPPRTGSKAGHKAHSKKDSGFRFHSSARAQKKRADNARRHKNTAVALLFVAGGIAALVAIARFTTPDFTLIAAALLGLCGVIAYDIVTRRAWEHILAARYETLARNHDRLVREVARNRNEISQLKEQLAQAAHAVEAEGRRLPPATSTEARMLETIVGKLGALSTAPRPQIGAGWDDSVMELEMAPPPVKALPRTEVESALFTDPAKISDAKVREFLQQAVRHDAVDVFMQPVVSLPQRKARLIEVYARIRAGHAGHLPAARYMGIAQAEGLVASIDNLLLLRCLQLLRDSRDAAEGVPCILNVTAATLHDSGFMNDLVAFLAQHKALAARLVFELPQGELQDIDGSLTPVLAGLAQLGCRFSMDRVTNRRFSINRLRAQHVRYLKLDAEWLIREGSVPGGIGRISHMKRQLDGAGIDLIVEKIEDEEALRELLDFNIDFGQGFLFGRPEFATSQAFAGIPRRAA
jgi:cyclic-di-GMP phosphodiesterase TipF (flagellum assembly factor)